MPRGILTATAMITYFILAIACIMAGRAMMRRELVYKAKVARDAIRGTGSLDRWMGADLVVRAVEGTQEIGSPK